jgi:hypothetical protein
MVANEQVKRVERLLKIDQLENLINEPLTECYDRK